MCVLDDVIPNFRTTVNNVFSNVDIRTVLLSYNLKHL